MIAKVPAWALVGAAVVRFSRSCAPLAHAMVTAGTCARPMIGMVSTYRPCRRAMTGAVGLDEPCRFNLGRVPPQRVTVTPARVSSPDRCTVTDGPLPLPPGNVRRARADLPYRHVNTRRG